MNVFSNEFIELAFGKTALAKELEKLGVGSTFSAAKLLTLTDGVSDAYGSTAEIIDKLKVLPSYNPTAVAESLIAGAMDLSNGALKDDMTVLAVRIVKNSQMDNFNARTVA